MSRNAARERLLPILKDTGCKTGQHMFVTSGIVASTKDLPAPNTLCNCGMLRAYPGFDGYEIEPPDSEDEPDNFGISKDGELLWVVQVNPW